MARTTILDLPSELVASILQHLDTQDVFAARLSTKAIERASFSLFGRRFFRKKGYMITTPSLGVFKSVAAHKGLRQYVQHVWFNPDCYTFGDPPEPHEGISNDDSVSQTLAWYTATNDYRALQTTSRLELELATALRTLPNLKAIGMRRSEDHNPWGWSRLQTTIGSDPRILGDIPTEDSTCLSAATFLFIALLKALAASNTKIQRLYTDAIEIDNILQYSLPSSVLAQACQSILYIELNATKAWLTSSAANEPHTRLSHPMNYGEGLQRLLAATPNLRELGLQIFPDRKQSHLVAPVPHDSESWRSSYPYVALSRLTTNVRMSHLRRVKLEKFTTTPTTLQALLEPSAANLISLKLRDVRLLSSTPMELGTPDCTNDKPWRSFFSFLSSSCPSLSYALLSHLSHAHGSVRFVQDLPPPVRDPALPRLSTVANAGDFTEYENITVEARGLEQVQSRLQGLADAHWYGRYCFSYAMDESIWHTDTSDEEW